MRFLRLYVREVPIVRPKYYLASLLGLLMVCSKVLIAKAYNTDSRVLLLIVSWVSLLLIAAIAVREYQYHISGKKRRNVRARAIARARANRRVT